MKFFLTRGLTGFPLPSTRSLAVLEAVGLMKPNGFDPDRTALFSFKPVLDGFGLPTGTAMPPPLRLCSCGNAFGADDFGLPAAPLCSSVVKWSMARVYVPMPGIRLTVLADELRLFNELLELRRLLPLEEDRSTGLGAAALAARTTGAAGLGPVAFAAGLTDAATATLVAGLCSAGCGVLKLLVLFGTSVLPATASPTADGLTELIFFRGSAVTATGPLLLLLCVLVSLLPLLSARAIVLGPGFSLSKLPDDVSWLSDSADIRLTDSSKLKNPQSATVTQDGRRDLKYYYFKLFIALYNYLVIYPNKKFLYIL